MTAKGPDPQKVEVLKVWYSVFCTLVDAYREDEYNAPQFIGKMLKLRDELTKAVPVMQFAEAYHLAATPQDDLKDAAMLIKRLAHKLKGQEVAEQALDWLKRKGLQGSILRSCEHGAIVKVESEGAASPQDKEDE